MTRSLLTSSLVLILGVCAPAAEIAFSAQPNLEELPQGHLRATIAALPEPAKARALQTLAGRPLADCTGLHASETGHLWYACRGLAQPDQGAAVPDQAPLTVISKAPVPVSNPPRRNSRPGASKAIFLDFNGGIVTGTQWNTQFKTTSWNAKPYSSDNDLTTFSDAEQAAIIAIWERVSEDFAPFDVNVTTVQPTLGPNTAWALITDTTDVDNKPMPHVGYGGLAYVGVFGEADFQKFSPALVTDYRSNTIFYTTAIADATSHEVGHNLDLSHDGNSRQEYEQGFQGSNVAPTWGPIMGGPYGCTVIHWSKGDYFDANNKEDDLAIITKNLPFIVDDHGGANTPTSLLIAAKAFSATGLIGKSDDRDSFRISFGTGPITATVATYNTTGTTDGGNLKAQLTLSTTAGVVVATSAPNSGTGATIATSVNNGTYILTVEPLACGTPTDIPRTGFINYGNMGKYTLTGTGEPGSNNNGSNVGVGSGVVNNNAGGQGNDNPLPTYDGASQDDGGGGCGLGGSVGLLLCGLGLMFLRFHLRKD